MAFKNNGINVADIARMERNFATEMVNANVPAMLSFSTSTAPAPYLGDWITYKQEQGGELVDVNSGYKSLIGIVKPSDARSNIMSPANPYEDLRSIGYDQNEISGYVISPNGGHGLLQINTSLTITIDMSKVSQTKKTSVYYRIFGLDKNGVQKWTMLASETIPYDDRAEGRDYRVNLAITTGAVVEMQDRILFGVSFVDYEGEFPTGVETIPQRWNANMQLMIRKYANAKP